MAVAPLRGALARLLPTRAIHARRSYATLKHAFTVDKGGITINIGSLNTSFGNRWLRDACQCPKCIHPSTRQKLQYTADIPADITPNDTRVRLATEGLEVEWADGHKSYYPISFLQTHSSRGHLAAFHKDSSPVLWNLDKIMHAPHLFLPYPTLKEPHGLLKAMTQLLQYGLLFISGVPNTEMLDDACELPVLANHFGEIRETFYGQLFDVKNVRHSANIAYTNLDLGLHMDLLYFKHPPRYQVLHCLRNRVVGGASIFVDALYAADELRRTQKADFETLVNTPISFHYINDGHHLHHEHYTIELSPIEAPQDISHSITGTPPVMQKPIIHVNYSPPFMAPLFTDTPTEFYGAFREFTRLLRRPQSTYIYTLKEGDAVLFDNRRVLHARTAFRNLDSDERTEGETKVGETNRWLKGCYLQEDALLDRIRVLKGKLDVVQP